MARSHKSNCSRTRSVSVQSSLSFTVITMIIYVSSYFILIFIDIRVLEILGMVIDESLIVISQFIRNKPDPAIKRQWYLPYRFN